jgi:hypothetical protein
MSILIITVHFTTDEAAFLASLLARWSETAPANSAERFWLEHLHNRVHQEMVDVVAADSAARLAASSAPAGFTLPPAAPASQLGAGNASNSVIGAGGGSGGGGGVIIAAVGGGGRGTCTCGYPFGSTYCASRRTQGTHP